MATSTVQVTTDRIRDSSLKRRKRKKMIQKQQQSDDRDPKLIENDLQITQWKSDARQRDYRSKLFEAIRQGSSSSASNKDPPSPLLGRGIRETADRVLAVTAKGRTRWSRAILTNKLKLKFMMINRSRSRRRGVAVATKRRGLRLKWNNVQNKARVLGGLVPGCRKQRLPVVLEEATTYIPALQMQVRAMTELFHLLSAASTSVGSRPPPSL